MEKTIKIRAYIEMDIEVPEKIDNFIEFAVSSMEDEIQYNIERQLLSCDDFNYGILEIHDGSLIDGTGDFSNKGV